MVLEGVQDLGERTLLHALISTRIDVPEGSMASELLEAVVPHLLALARAAVDDRPHTPADLGLTIDPPVCGTGPALGRMVGSPTTGERVGAAGVCCSTDATMVPRSLFRKVGKRSGRLERQSDSRREQIEKRLAANGLC